MDPNRDFEPADRNPQPEIGVRARSIADFRDEVRQWCDEHVPTEWRESQTGATDATYAAFQKWWFQELRRAGYAVPHWPARWGGGMSTAEQVVLHQELADHDAPRLSLPFVSIHHAASTLFDAGTDKQKLRHLPAILDGEIWVQGFTEPDAGSDLASLRTSAIRRDDEIFLVNGQKLWASGAQYADWCLLLARTDPGAPKHHGISYFFMDMRSRGVEVRPIRQATGASEFCEIFLDDVEVPVANLVGPENDGWKVAQKTLEAERGMTILELAERLQRVGFRLLLERCRVPGPGGRPIDAPVVRDRLAQFETELAALRAMCASVVRAHDIGTSHRADVSVLKLVYSELLQKMTDFGAEVAGVEGHNRVDRPRSSGWESGAWTLDFIGSWEWTIPGGTSEIQRTIIAERGLGLPREPIAARQ